MTELSERSDELDKLLADSGLDSDELLEALKARSSRPLVKDHVANYLKRRTEGTRRGYATHLNRLVNGYGAVCDQTCEPCLDISGDQPLKCNCTCRACISSRITVQPRGDEHVGPTVYDADVVNELAVIAKRLAVKRGLVENRTRAARGLAIKNADGIGAEETAIAALRSLFETATAHTDGINAALKIDKPHRNTRERRPMREFELLELCHLTSTSGNDPSLDELIVDFGIATGSRREGVYLLSVGQLHRDKQTIEMKDKYKRRQPAPVSAELIDRLVSHAIERGGAVCNPSSPMYRPDSKVFHYKMHGDTPHPLTSRRFDNLSQRWQTSLVWARDEQLGYHHLRHTMAAYLATHFGPQYKKRYLRHADGSATEIYGVCTFEELARAISELLGFEHPLVHGLDERRKATLLRFGMSDDD
jgi:integrase